MPSRSIAKTSGAGSSRHKPRRPAWPTPRAIRPSGTLEIPSRAWEPRALRRPSARPWVAPRLRPRRHLARVPEAAAAAFPVAGVVEEAAAAGSLGAAQLVLAQVGHQLDLVQTRLGAAGFAFGHAPRLLLCREFEAFQVLERDIEFALGDGALALDFLERGAQIFATYFDGTQERRKGETTDIG